MAIKLVATYSEDDSTETLDLYEAIFDDDTGLDSIDIWAPKGSVLTTTDIHVEFEGQKED